MVYIYEGIAEWNFKLFVRVNRGEMFFSLVFLPQDRQGISCAASRRPIRRLISAYFSLFQYFIKFLDEVKDIITKQ